MTFGRKDEKLTKKEKLQENWHMQLYFRVFLIFLPNVIKIVPYNFDLHRFKVGAFFWDTV